MSNAPTNREQSTLLIQTPNQLNPGAAKPSDFPVEVRDGGQTGDTAAERARLLRESDYLKPRPRGDELPDRNKVPSKHE